METKLLKLHAGLIDILIQPVSQGMYYNVNTITNIDILFNLYISHHIEHVS